MAFNKETACLLKLFVASVGVLMLKQDLGFPVKFFECIWMKSIFSCRIPN